MGRTAHYPPNSWDKQFSLYHFHKNPFNVCPAGWPSWTHWRSSFRRRTAPLTRCRHPLQEVTASVRARGAGCATVCGLRQALQRLDLVESFGELLLQALDSFLLVEDAAFEQGAAGDQRALSLARWQAEDIGDDLVGGSLVCHWPSSSGVQVQDPSRPEGPSSGENRGADGAVLTEVIGPAPSVVITYNHFRHGNLAIEGAREPRHRLAGYRYASLSR